MVSGLKPLGLKIDLYSIVKNLAKSLPVKMSRWSRTNKMIEPTFEVPNRACKMV